MMASARSTRLGRATKILRIRTLGILFFAVVVAFVWLTVAIYNKTFTKVVKVDLVTDTIGNTLPQHADVKVRGLTVGRVKSSETENGKVTSKLEIQPAMADKIPSNVTARLLPKTLFGERYVDLVLPKEPSAASLTAANTITQDKSGNAIELSRLLDSLLPLLQAVPPQSLASTLGALSQALAGRGTDLGLTVDRLDTIFAQVNTELPDLQQALRSFATVSDTYSEALPQLIDTLDNLRTTNATVIERRADVDALIASLTPTAGRAADFFEANRANLIDLAADSREALESLATYSPTFPCTMKNFAEAMPQINEILGQGTNTPGSHVSVKFVNPRGRYLPNQDEPRWLDTRGPQCEHRPPLGTDPGQYVGGALNDGSYQPPTRNPGAMNVDLPRAQFSAYPAKATIAGSPMERQTLGAIYGAATGLGPKDIPAWAMRTGAPALRGSEVSVK